MKKKFSTYEQIKVCIVLGSLLFAEPLRADFSGPVVSILDGDTIEVLHSHRAERIRLNGIDCPEKGQAYGYTRNCEDGYPTLGRRGHSKVANRLVQEGWG